MGSHGTLVRTYSAVDMLLPEERGRWEGRGVGRREGERRGRKDQVGRCVFSGIMTPKSAGLGS